MNKFSIFTLAVFLLLSGLACERKAEHLPTVSSEVEVSKYVGATECYVLFFLEGSGKNLQEAKEKIDLKLNHFIETARKKIPDAQPDVISGNIGPRDFNTYRATKNSFTPDIAKVLLFTLPPDEALAVKLLDAGIESGLVPFCASSPDGTFGAVFYGLRDADAEIDRLYPQAVQELRKQAQKLTDELGREIVQMDDISRYAPRDDPYELRFGDIIVPLPSAFCSSDRNKIKVSLTLRAHFTVKNTQGNLH